MDENAAREAGRQQLLNNLYVVRNYIKQTTDLSAQRVKLTGNFREYQNTIGPAAAAVELEKIDPNAIRGQLFFKTFAIAYALMNGIGCILLEQDLFSAGIFAALGYYLFSKRWEKGKLKIVCYILLGFMLYTQLKMCLEFPIGLLVLGILLALALVIAFFAMKKAIAWDNRGIAQENTARNAQVASQNQQIAERNRRIQAQNQATRQYNQQLAEQINVLDQQIAALAQGLEEFGAGWYPPHYYSLYAVQQFILEVYNYRAYTVQEMVNIFEQSEHWKRQEAGQQQIAQQLRQLRSDVGQIRQAQSQIIGELQYANALQLQKVFQDQWNVERIRSSIERNTEATSRQYGSTYIYRDPEK